MSEFDSWDFGGGNSTPTPSKPASAGGGKGGWYFPLTLLGLVLVGGLSILMSFLTRGVSDRPIWMMGLIFMIPAGAMFFAAMLLEFITGAMTPRMSRKPQVIIAVVATILTFVVGCVCDALYLYGGFIRNAGVNFVFAVDRGDTSEWQAYSDGTPGTRGEALNACAESLLEKMPRYTDVAVLPFDWEALTTPVMSKANDGFRLAFHNALAMQGDEGVSYANALYSAVDVVMHANTSLPTRILLFTGGDEAVYLLDEQGDVVNPIASVQSEALQTVASEEARADLIASLQRHNCSLYVISPTPLNNDALREVAAATGGLCVTISEAATVPEFVSIITIDGDMLRSGSVTAMILSFVMLLLEGVVIGVCISIMLSRMGQKRFQMILSPIMAIVSFVMMKLLGSPDHNPVGLWWLWEGLSFLPLGVIFMTSNAGNLPQSAPVKTDAFEDPGFAGGFDEFGGSSSGGASSGGFDDFGSSSSSGGFDDFGSSSGSGSDKQSSGSDFDW